MRVALVADTHGVLDSRIAAAIVGCDVLVHAGDIGAAAVLDAMRQRAGRLVAVRGNNDTSDKWPDSADGADPAALPVRATLDLPGGTLVIVHGDAWRAKDRHTRLRREFPDARAVVYGHSHRLVIDDAEFPWILNPGAAGRARTYGGPSFILLEISQSGWKLTPQRFDKVEKRTG